MLFADAYENYESEGLQRHNEMQEVIGGIKAKPSGTFKLVSDACPALQVFYNSFSRENVKLLDS